MAFANALLEAEGQSLTCQKAVSRNQVQVKEGQWQLPYNSVRPKSSILVRPYSSMAGRGDNFATKGQALYFPYCILPSAPLAPILRPRVFFLAPSTSSLSS